MIHSQSLLDHNESTAKEAAERLKEEETQLYLLANKTFEAPIILAAFNNINKNDN